MLLNLVSELWEACWSHPEALGDFPRALGRILERCWRLLECSWSVYKGPSDPRRAQGEIKGRSTGDQAAARGGVGDGISSLSPGAKGLKGMKGMKD